MVMERLNTPSGRPSPSVKLELKGPIFSQDANAILSENALAFLEVLVAQFAPSLEKLMSARAEKQQKYDRGDLPGFRADTLSIRKDLSWKVAPVPAPLTDRRVEITGPVDRKMVINALNSGANVFMCCFEDATSPTWENMVRGQINMRDANNGTIEFTDPKSGKHYALAENPAVLIARPRGLHLRENHITFNGKPVPGCLMDFALYFFHNHASRAAKGQGVYYYLPKLESMEEAQWWEEVFTFTENHFGVETGTVRATVLIETLPAVFQMEEILYALRHHIVGMNCGRWDYIFSYIKTLRNHKDRILPDRHAVGMDKPFLDAYSKRLIQTCHRRGAFAMGGMSAFIPAKDPEQMAFVTQKVTEDKHREAQNGHDGTWVAHPYLVELARGIFDQYLKAKPNQLDVMPEGEFGADVLLAACDGPKDGAGVRKNIRIALYYMESWLRGAGCVPIYGLMEDAATAEISRANIWQWLHHEVSLDDGTPFTPAVFRQFLKEELDHILKEIGQEALAGRQFEKAAEVFDKLSTDEDFADFLTLPCYELLD